MSELITEGECAIPDCPGKPGKPADVFCAEHWHELPRELRAKLHGLRVHYQRSGNARPYLEVVIYAMTLLAPPEKKDERPKLWQRVKKWWKPEQRLVQTAK